MTKRLVYICDWLPPDFGAVGQYAVLEAREWANAGWSVSLIGLTSGQSREEKAEALGEGTVEVIRLLRIARTTAVKSRTQAMNAIHSIVVTAPDQIRDELVGLNSVGSSDDARTLSATLTS